MYYVHFDLELCSVFLFWLSAVVVVSIIGVAALGGDLGSGERAEATRVLASSLMATASSVVLSSSFGRSADLVRFSFFLSSFVFRCSLVCSLHLKFVFL